MDKKVILSIVTTMYKSSPYIHEFYTRISQEAIKITEDYEIIFVDDGSPDDSLQKAVELYEKHKKVKVIELSRNFGHHKAMMTGPSHAKGEFIFLIDSDLEEEPELLERFWEELYKEKNLDVVYGVQESRKGKFFERISGSLFFDFEKVNYKIWTGYKINDNDKELILNKSENSIILDLDLNSKISYSKAKAIIPLFSYQYIFPFINNQCQNIKELHLQAYEQYKNDFPKNIENIEYFEKRYNFYLNSINQINKDTEKNQDNYKSYCNKFDASVKFNFIEILPESNFSYVGIGK